MKTKKYEMNGGGEKGKKWKTTKKIGKAISGSTLFQGYRLKKHGDIDPREKKRSLPGKIASELTGLPTVGRILRAPKQILYSVPKYLATRGLVRQFAFTRSGKAQKEIRQTTGIKDYNKIKKQADSLEAKKQKYKDKLKTLAENAKTVSNANTRSKLSKIFGRRLQTKSYYGEDGVERQSWLQRKFGKQTKSTMIDIKSRKIEKKQEAIKKKEQFILDKWKKRIAFQKTKKNEGKRKGKTVFEGIINGDLKQSLTAASKHVEDQKRIKRDEALQKAFESKKTYTDAKSKFDAVEGNFKTARDKYYSALATAGGKANLSDKDKKEYADALEAYREARSSKTKYSIEVPKTSFGSPVLGDDGRQETELKEVTYKDMQGYIRGLQKIYNKDQTNYQKIAGKAQTLEQLADRSRNTESLKRGLKKLLPGARPFGGLLTTYGKILSSANKTTKTGTNTAKTKRNKELIVKYWTKDKEGREQKLKEYLATGSLNLSRPGKTQKIDPKTKQVMTLEEIIKKEVSDPNNPSKQINIVDTMQYKDYLVHLKKLQSKGDITSKEYEVLQKYGKAKRINKIINASDKKTTSLAIDQKMKIYNEVKKNLGDSATNYVYGTPIKKTDLVIGFGTNAGDISKVKLLSLIDYESKEEEYKSNIELKNIEAIPTNDKKGKNNKIRKIKEFCDKYGIPVPTDGSTPKINLNTITQYVVNTSTVFKDPDVEKVLQEVIFKDDVDPGTKKINKPIDINTFKTKYEVEEKIEFTKFVKINTTSGKIQSVQSGLPIINTDEGKKFKAKAIISKAFDEQKKKIDDIIATKDIFQINKLKELGLVTLDANNVATKVSDNIILKHMLNNNSAEINTEIEKIDSNFKIDTLFPKSSPINVEDIKDISSMKAGALGEIEVKKQAKTSEITAVEKQITDLKLGKTKVQDEPQFIDFKNSKIDENVLEKSRLFVAEKAKLPTFLGTLDPQKVIIVGTPEALITALDVAEKANDPNTIKTAKEAIEAFKLNQANAGNLAQITAYEDIKTKISNAEIIKNTAEIQQKIKNTEMAFNEKTQDMEAFKTKMTEEAAKTPETPEIEASILIKTLMEAEAAPVKNQGAIDAAQLALNTFKTANVANPIIDEYETKKAELTQADTDLKTSKAKIDPDNAELTQKITEEQGKLKTITDQVALDAAAAAGTPAPQKTKPQEQAELLTALMTAESNKDPADIGAAKQAIEQFKTTAGDDADKQLILDYETQKVALDTVTTEQKIAQIQKINYDNFSIKEDQILTYFSNDKTVNISGSTNAEIATKYINLKTYKQNKQTFVDEAAKIEADRLAIDTATL